MSVTRRSSLAALALALLALCCAPAARATPSGTKIDAIYLTKTCASSVCDPSHDTALKRGSHVGGTIQIHVSSHSDVLGLEWVRIEATYAAIAPRWICVQQWNYNGAQDSTEHYDWDTVKWPKPGPGWGCPEVTPHFHGEPTVDANFQIRVLAHEQASGGEQPSTSFPLTITNAPSAPVWNGDPFVTVTGGKPGVTLRWAPNPETDISEYHFVRVGPRGDTSEFAVSATAPQNQGCRSITGITYECGDANFPAGSGGSYRYVIIAYRWGAGSGHCALTKQTCVQSKPSAVKTVSVPVVAQGLASPSASTSGAAAAGGAHGATTDEPVKVASAPNRSNEIALAERSGAGGTGGGGARGVLLAIAGLLVALGAGAHAREFLASRRA